MWQDSTEPLKLRGLPPQGPSPGSVAPVGHCTSQSTTEMPKCQRLPPAVFQLAWARASAPRRSEGAVKPCQHACQRALYLHSIASEHSITASEDCQKFAQDPLHMLWMLPPQRLAHPVPTVLLADSLQLRGCNTALQAATWDR